MADRHHIIGIAADAILNIDVHHETQDDKQWFYSADMHFVGESDEDREQGVRSIGLYEQQLVPVALALLKAWDVIQEQKRMLPKQKRVPPWLWRPS